jgi:hypothetical protein
MPWKVKASGPEGLVELQPVIGGLRFAERGELVGGGPVEATRVDHRAAHDRAVAGEVFRRGMHHQRGAQLDRAAQVGGCRSVVHDQRNARVIGDGGDGRNVGDVAAGIGDRLAEHGAGVIVDGRLHRVEIVEIDEFRGPAEALDGLAELRDGAAVKASGHDDVPPRRHDREKRHDLRRVARRAADRADAALERGDAFLQHGDRGIGQARVDEAHFLKVEQRRRVLGIAEDIGRGLVDRGLPRAGGRVGSGAGVDLERIEAVGRAVGHGSSSSWNVCWRQD